MLRRVRRLALLVPLVVSGCGVSLAQFTVPAQGAAGSVVSITIAGNITGNTGEAGCVLQLPNGWAVQSVTNQQNWGVVQDKAALLAAYVAEPGHHLVAFSGTGANPGHGLPQTLSYISLNVSIAIPATAAGPNRLKLSLANNNNFGDPWTVVEPAGINRFSAITTGVYVQILTVIGAAGFVSDAAGLPQSSIPGTIWSGVAFGDVNGDGRDDLAAVTTSGGTDVYLAGPGTTWTSSSSGLSSSSIQADVAFGDFDGDGRLDLVTGNGQVYFGNGGANWTAAGPLPLTLAASAYRNVATGDVNGDGFDDIAIAAGDNAGTLQVLLSQGNGTFVDASAGLPAATTGDWSNTVWLVDLDGDGKLDILWAHALTPSAWLGDGLGGWTPGTGLPSPATNLAPGDFDGDGVPEIVVPDDFAGGLSVFRYASGATWTPWAVTGLPTAGFYRPVIALDYDRDGRADFVSSTYASSVYRIEAWHNTGSGFVLDPASGLPNAQSAYTHHFAVGDFDGNTFPDLAITTGPGPQSAGTLRTFQNRHTGVAPFGLGCGGGSVAEPQLQWFGVPQRGNTFAVQVESLTPGAIVAFWLGGYRFTTGQGAVPLDLTPLGAPGCTIWTTIEWPWIGQVDAAGHFTVPLAVPSDPYLDHLTFYGQGAEWAATANPYGVVFTRALALRIE